MRDTITLKRAWDNLKAMARKTRAAERGNLIATGGGPSLPPQPPQQVAILNMVQEASPSLICEVKNKFDSDAAAMQLNELTSSQSTDTELNLDLGTIDFNSLVASQAIITGDAKKDCGLQVICTAGPSDEKEKPVIELQEVTNEVQEVTQSHCSENWAPTKKASDYIRREGVLRVKALEAKNKKEQQLLKLKMEAQENDTKRAGLLLQAALTENKRAELSFRRGELLFEAAKLEVEFQRKRLGQLFPNLN